MNVTKTMPLNEQQLIEMLAQKFSCAPSVETLKAAIQDHTSSIDGSRKILPPNPQEMALIMQSAQGIYFGAFSKWLGNRIHKNDLEEHLTDTDIQAGINRDALVNPYIGMISAVPRMKSLGCEEVFLEAKTKTLEIMVIVVFEDGLAPTSFHKLLKEGFIDRSLDPNEYLIAVDIRDAKNYACNLICLGNKVLLPRCSAELQKKISEKGYEVSCSDVDNFVLAGGGIHCLTNPINQRKSSPSYQL